MNQITNKKIKEDILKIIEAEAKAILSIPITDSFGKAVDLINKAVHSKKGKVVASGVGKAGNIALNIAKTLSATGTPAIFLNPSEAQHGDLGIIQPNDVLLLFSNSGKTKEVIELCKLVKMLKYQLKIISITGNQKSELGKISDITISTGNPKEVCPLELTPTTSTTAMKVAGDILIVLMIQKIGLTFNDYAKMHPGGYLGIKSRNAAKK